MSSPSASPSTHRNRTRAWWILAVFGFCVFPFALVWWIVNYGVRTLSGLVEGREAEVCRQRLARVGRVFDLYAADHDGRYPPAEVWVDVTWPYGEKKKGRDPNHPKPPEDPLNESESIFRCPSLSKLRTGEFGYAMNLSLSATSRAEVEGPDIAPLVFDSNLLTRNARSKADSMPMPPRHRSSRDNYAVTASGSIRSFHAGDRP